MTGISHTVDYGFAVVDLAYAHLLRIEDEPLTLSCLVWIPTEYLDLSRTDWSDENILHRGKITSFNCDSLPSNVFTDGVATSVETFDALLLILQVAEDIDEAS